MGEKRDPIKGAEIARIIAEERAGQDYSPKDGPEFNCGLPHWGQQIQGSDRAGVTLYDARFSGGVVKAGEDNLVEIIRR